jgi:phosphopantetheine adenylyltransferase
MNTQTQIQNANARGTKQAELINLELKGLNNDTYEKVSKKVDYLLTKINASNKVDLVHNIKEIQQIFEGEHLAKFKELNFGINFKWLRAENNRFKLFGYFTKFQALKYAVNDKVDFTTTKSLLLKFQKSMDIESKEMHKLFESKANKVTELRKKSEAKFHPQSTNEITHFEYLKQVTELFEGELGKNAVYFMFKENIELLAQMVVSEEYFVKGDITKFIAEKVETLKFESKLKTGQLAFLSYYATKEQMRVITEMKIQTTEGGAKVAELLAQMDKPKAPKAPRTPKAELKVA